MKEISIIIPYQYNGERREYLFQIIKKQYENDFPNTEIIVSEDKIKPFNKSIAINKGVERSNGDIIMIADADTIVPKNYLLNSIQILDGFIFPFKFYHFLNEEETNKFLQTSKASDSNAWIIKNDFGVRNTGGVQIVTRELFEKLGKYDERFTGWGWEDLEFVWRVYDELGDVPILDYGHAYHMWHERPVASPNNAILFYTLGRKEFIL